MISEASEAASTGSEAQESASMIIRKAQEAASTGSEAQKVLPNDQRGTRGRVGNIDALESSSMISNAQEAASAISRRKSPHQ